MNTKSFLALLIAVLVLGGSIGGAFAGGMALGKSQVEETISQIAGLLGLAGGLGLDSSGVDSSEDSGLQLVVRDSQIRVSQLQAEVHGLRADLEEVDSASQVLVENLATATRKEKALQMQLSQAEERASSALLAQAQMESDLELLASTQEQVAALEEQIKPIQLQAAKDQGNLEAVGEMSDTIERHRLLLVDLRKEVPQTRKGSLTYWRGIKTTATKADPALASSANNVILRIDSYYDWNDMSPDPTVPPAEFANAYFEWQARFTVSGAEAYVEATDNFTRDALLAVINQMDSVVSKLN